MITHHKPPSSAAISRTIIHPMRLEGPDSAPLFLQIAALKKAKKGKPVILMDQSGNNARAVAKELSARGFSQVYVVDGGFKGWISNKLPTKRPAVTAQGEGTQKLFGPSGTRIKSRK